MNEPNNKGIRNQDLDSPWIDPFYTLGMPPCSITGALIPIYLPCRCRRWSEAHGPAAGRNELLKSWPWRSPACRRRLCRGLCRWWRWLRWPWQGKRCNVTHLSIPFYLNRLATGLGSHSLLVQLILVILKGHCVDLERKFKTQNFK